MIPKTIATLLILFAFATVSANLASAQGTGFKWQRIQWGEAVAASMAATPMGAASTDEDPTEEASVYTGSWTATGTITTVDFPTGTESLLVTMSALSSASV